MGSHIVSNENIEREQNSFTFVRMSLAVLVIFSHCYRLGGFDQEPLLTFSHNQSSFGSLAVDCFFIISGLFVVESFIASHSVWRYLWKRVLRIFPAYWVCLMTTAFVFGLIVYYFERGNFCYFQTVENNPLRYVGANWFLIIRQRGIANLFATNPYSLDFNGSLWILKYQALCYLSLVLIGFKSMPKYRRQVFLGLFLFFWWANIFEANIKDIASAIAPEVQALGVPNVFVYFLAGSVFFLYVENIPLKRNLFICLVVAAVLGLRMGLHNVVGPVALPYILLYLGKKLPLGKISKWGDYSYGIYIYAFPIQQTLVFFGINRYGILGYFTLSVLITLPLAIMSWRLIEKPCLGLKALELKSLLSILPTRRKKENGKLKPVLSVESTHGGKTENKHYY